MRTGEVKFFNPTKGFGFIRGDDGKDTFFHISAVTNREELTQGDRVTFDIAVGDRGEKAIKVVLA